MASPDGPKVTASFQFRTMSATALFGNTSALGGSSGGNKHLVEFRAGRMTLKGRMVHPDKRKGLLYVYQGEDSLMHFCWKDRTTGEVEDDLLIFPDDCEFVRVNECTTGRVYVLKFKSFSKKYFFWMQVTPYLPLYIFVSLFIFPIL